MCTPRRILLALVATLLLGSSTAYGWSHATTDDGTPLSWDTPVVTYVVDAWADLDGADLVEATCRSTREWSDVGGVDLTVDCATGSNLTAGYLPDGPNQNTVTVAPEGWTSDGAHLALTVSTFVVETGALLDTDIIVSAPADTAWSTRGIIDHDRYDLHTAIMHEIGHGLGLGHEFGHDHAVMFPTLAPGSTERRELHDDDCAGLRALYGDNTMPTEPSVDEPADKPVVEPTEEMGAASPNVTDPASSGASYDGETSWDDGIEFNNRETLSELDCSAASSQGGLPMLLAILGIFGLRPPTRRRRNERTEGTARRMLAVAAALMVSAPAVVVADTARLLPIEELVAQADVVVTAEVVDTSSRWDGGHIVTDATLSVDQCVTGACSATGETMIVTSLGGVVDGIGQRVSGATTWDVGQHVLVFVADLDATPRVVAMSQGVFGVEAADSGPVAVRHLHGLVLLHPTAGHALPSALERYDLAALVRVVAQTGARY